LYSGGLEVQSIIGILEKHARVIPDKIAIIFHDTRITYGELNGTVNRLANSLIGLGLKKGDRVGLMTPRVPELVISFLAVVKFLSLTAASQTMPGKRSLIQLLL
jgi:acyl-CoA synthetase (AMP-forming)/AMP-acid ligase II